MLFPKIPDALKVTFFFFFFAYSCIFYVILLFDIEHVQRVFIQSQTGDEAFNDNGLIPRTIRLLKDKYPEIVSIFVLYFPRGSN